MKKVHVTITLDYELYAALKDGKYNISSTLNEMLKDAIQQKSPEMKQYFDALQASKDIKQQVELAKEALAKAKKERLEEIQKMREFHG